MGSKEKKKFWRKGNICVEMFSNTSSEYISLNGIQWAWESRMMTCADVYRFFVNSTNILQSINTHTDE